MPAHPHLYQAGLMILLVFADVSRLKIHALSLQLIFSNLHDHNIKPVLHKNPGNSGTFAVMLMVNVMLTVVQRSKKTNDIRHFLFRKVQRSV